MDGAEDLSTAAMSQKSVETEIFGLFKDQAALSSDTKKMTACLLESFRKCQPDTLGEHTRSRFY